MFQKAELDQTLVEASIRLIFNSPKQEPQILISRAKNQAKRQLYPRRPQGYKQNRFINEISVLHRNALTIALKKVQSIVTVLMARLATGVLHDPIWIDFKFVILGDSLTKIDVLPVGTKAFIKGAGFKVDFSMNEKSTTGNIRIFGQFKIFQSFTV